MAVAGQTVQKACLGCNHRPLHRPEHKVIAKIPEAPVEVRFTGIVPLYCGINGGFVSAVFCGKHVISRLPESGDVARQCSFGILWKNAHYGPCYVHGRWIRLVERCFPTIGKAAVLSAVVLKVRFLVTLSLSS